MSAGGSPGRRNSAGQFTKGHWVPVPASSPVTPVYGSELLPQRVWDKIAVRENGCWEWTAARYPNGYGMVSVGQKLWRVHRLVFLVFRGPIPTTDLDHYLWPDGGCVGRACGLHVQPATRKANLKRGVTLTARNAGITHCPRGHAYAGANLYVDREGGRRCRECRRITDAAREQGRPVGLEEHKQRQRLYLADKPHWSEQRSSARL